MRSLDKGTAPRVYNHYREALSDLVIRIGCYCSYCEMPIPNQPDVEHVQPKSRGGSLTSWENLLLGCKKCNGIKRNKNPDRADHLWPDEDNTFVAYDYVNEVVVQPAAHLTAPAKDHAMNTLKLTGIDRVPGRISSPTKKDKMDFRWQKRREAWGRAHRALANWRTCSTPAMADQIAETAGATGFYSIWAMVFKMEPMVLSKIEAQFVGTYHPVTSPSGGYQLRSGGRY